MPFSLRGRHLGCKKLILAFLFRESGSTLELSPSGWWARTQKHMMLGAWRLLRNRSRQVWAADLAGALRQWGGEGWQSSWWCYVNSWALPKLTTRGAGSTFGQAAMYFVSWAVQAEFQEYSVLETHSPPQLNPTMSSCGLTGFGAPEWEEDGWSYGI